MRYDESPDEVEECGLPGQTKANVHNPKLYLPCVCCFLNCILYIFHIIELHVVGIK